MIFLKLGGSLITDKTQDNTPRLDVLHRLAQEISQSLISQSRNLQSPLLLGHGSGSFGHSAAKKYGTRQGVSDAAAWRGFADVSVAAARLNRIVADSLHNAGVPVISVLPSASAVCVDGVLKSMDTQLITTALAHGLAPLVMGDVACDSVRGGTIVSTEEVFGYLSQQLPVTRILLAGETEGVYERYSHTNPGPIISRITPQNWREISGGIGASRGADVTGGMASKVRDMVALVQANPNIQVHIFSGLVEGNVARALAGESIGTRISAD